jgi:hypothetical protein
MARYVLKNTCRVKIFQVTTISLHLAISPRRRSNYSGVLSRETDWDSHWITRDLGSPRN